ncbi:MAG: hypothetical protein H6916_08780 [Novosphingobium sp.]|uniref:zinc ribbon domain-containing protein n=1 Tax=Novosphingobium sp. TaxID=1874826 RepID=UPI0026115276|nr:zinc ribbon domain-containing protein [Novosphingobium sp.]MCP5386897.1 hypothetical protein [Novosphingobium sp.]
MFVTFTNPQTGEQKIVKQGFSWMLFLLTEFYGIPLFIRGLHLHGTIVAMIGVVGVLSPKISMLVPLAGLGLIGSMVFYGIKGNELTMTMLERKGWVRTAPGALTFATGASPGAQANPMPIDGDKVCPRCAETVKAAAMACKHCGYAFVPGTPVQSSNKLLKGLGIGAAVLVGLAIIGTLVDPPKPSSATLGPPADNPSGLQVPEAAALPVTAAELYQDYQANEQAAQLKYGAQPVQIEGRISSIELDAADEPMISLYAGSDFADVTLHFGSNFAQEAARLEKGERFIAQCASITELLGAPQLSDCTYVGGGGIG